jgi:hypothetical protein
MNTKNRYGYLGNGIIAAVEFGARIKVKTIIEGGQSFNPASKHYTDHAGMYIEDKFKDVLLHGRCVKNTPKKPIIRAHELCFLKLIFENCVINRVNKQKPPFYAKNITNEKILALFTMPSFNICKYARAKYKV